MRRAAVSRRLSALLLGWAILLLAAQGAHAEEKSYQIPAVTINATVLPDGAMRVVEQRSVAFTGAWSWWEQWFPLEPDQRMEEISISVDGQPYRFDSSGTPGSYTVEHHPTHAVLKWHFQAINTQMTTEIHYTITNSVTVHNDIAELYRGFIGKTWDEGTGRAIIMLRLPPGARKEEIRAWGHGPLNGLVSIDSDSQVTWKVEGLPSKTFLEGRVLFPPSLVPAAGRRSGQAAVERILAEELGWAEKANQQRRWAQADIGIAALAVVVVIYLLWRRFGQVSGSFTGRYYRDLPSGHTPAEIGVLFRGRSGTHEFKATLLDLARRHYITLDPASTADFVVRWTGKHDHSNLKPYERRLLEFLFGTVAGGQQEFLLSMLSTYARKQAGSAASFFTSWQTEVDTAARDCGFWAPTTMRVGCLAPAALVVCAGITAMAGLLFTTAVLMVAVLPAGIASLGLRRSGSGEDEFSKWIAFRRFLTHFSRLDLAEVPALVLWEHYLVYATVLGVAKQVLKQMKTVLPRLPREQVLDWQRNMLSGSLVTGGDLTGLDRLSTALDSSVGGFQLATSPRADGLGRGGGFSSGGGGGAGSGGGGRGG